MTTSLKMSEVNVYSNQFGGFKNLNRTYDQESNQYNVGLSMGGIYITKEDEVISTVLGSCVSVCVRDTMCGVAGMNHFLIVGKESILSKHNGYMLFQYGLYSVEYLFDKILRAGGSKKTMEVKIFGGGSIISLSGDIGKNNICFIKNYIIENGYELTVEDVGGEFPRKVNYSAKTGKARVKRLRSLHKKVIINREKEQIISMQ